MTVFNARHIGPDDGEPARDERLGALLRQVVGDPPMAEVSWPQLAQRIAADVRAHQAAPWWSYAEHWQRRAIPLALAAGLVGALAFWGTATSRPAEASSSMDLVSAVVAGRSSTAEAASSYAHSLTGTMDLTGVPPE
jgi:hypothetical protein